MQNQPIGTFISNVLATDRDTGANGVVTYGFLNEDGTHFTLQVNGDGALLLSNFVADREIQDRYTVRRKYLCLIFYAVVWLVQISMGFVNRVCMHA